MRATFVSKKIAANLFKMYIDKLNTGAPEGKRAGHYITFIFACQVNFVLKNAQKNPGFPGFSHYFAQLFSLSVLFLFQF